MKLSVNFCYVKQSQLLTIDVRTIFDVYIDNLLLFQKNGRYGMYLFDEVWSKAMESVKEKNSIICETWITMITNAALDGETVTLAVPSEFVKTMILNRFSNIIASALASVLGFVPNIIVVTEQEKTKIISAALYDELVLFRTKMENEGLAYLQLGGRRLENNDKTGALKAFCHAYTCLCRVQYKSDDFHYQTVESLEKTIDTLSREIQMYDNTTEGTSDNH